MWLSASCVWRSKAFYGTCFEKGLQASFSGLRRDLKPPSRIRRPPFSSLEAPSQAPLQVSLRSPLQAPLRSSPFSSPLQAPFNPSTFCSPLVPPPGQRASQAPFEKPPFSSSPSPNYDGACPCGVLFSRMCRNVGPLLTALRIRGK